MSIKVLVAIIEGEDDGISRKGEPPSAHIRQFRHRHGGEVVVRQIFRLLGKLFRRDREILTDRITMSRIRPNVVVHENGYRLGLPGRDSGWRRFG